MADFFISYNAADAAKAEWIAHTLRGDGFSVRFAQSELEAGDSIVGWMREALDDSDRLIAVSSPDYFDPSAVYSEMEREAFSLDLSERIRRHDHSRHCARGGSAEDLCAAVAGRPDGG